MEAPPAGAYGNYLGDDEVPKLQVRRHWIVLVKPAAQAVAAVVVAGSLAELGLARPAGHPFDLFVAAVAAFFLVRLAYKAAGWWIDRVVVTDQRMLEISGILTRRVASMPLAKLTDLVLSRTLPGRLLGYGDLVVETAGQQQALTRIDHLPYADAFYKRLTTIVLARFAEIRPDSEEREHTPPHKEVRVVPPELADTQELPPIES
jgi:hypothetical protein